MITRITTSSLSALVLLLCLTLNICAAKEYRLPQAVVDFMATRRMRNHHFVWHNVREMWDLLSKDDQEKIRHYGWAPPRPSLRHMPNGEVIVEKKNGSGEDFLYMHRQMIKMANEVAQKVCPNAKVVGFKKVPAPGDKMYPVPPIYQVPGKEFEGLNQLISNAKTDEFYWNVIKVQEDQLNDPEFLKSLKLHELGAFLEYEIHTYMHARFSRKPKAARPQPAGVPVPFVDKKWDDPKYNWLADFYSAHVNRVFWKIHGYVDDKIDAWRKAHGLKEVPWKYTWEGGPESTVDKIRNVGADDDSNHDHNHDDGNDKNVQEVMKILLDSGKCGYYYHNAKWES